jgi:hypothetical protein
VESPLTGVRRASAAREARWWLAAASRAALDEATALASGGTANQTKRVVACGQADRLVPCHERSLSRRGSGRQSAPPQWHRRSVFPPPVIMSRHRLVQGMVLRGLRRNIMDIDLEQMSREQLITELMAHTVTMLTDALAQLHDLCNELLA